MIDIKVNEAGAIILFEVTVEVRNLVTKMLFNQHPTLERICEVIEDIFANHDKVKGGLVSLVLSVGDHDTILEVDDLIYFTDGMERIGFIELKTRTLFHA